jgi:alkylation response protein AidB-like acyl-CoA dehydrogenase
MDFHFSPQDESFRAELRDFLDRELPRDWAPGSVLSEYEGGADARWETKQRFSKKLVEKGWLALAWPQEYGGLGASHMQQTIYMEEMALRGAPGTGNMGIAWVGPAIMLYGTPEQKARWLPPITSGDDIWCTLYSEPGAGSDLAALQTRAIEDGDDFVINGQKIWTSGADKAHWGWLAARTNADAPKHKGISTFAVPMDAPGISIRPLVNIAGQAGFNEVFFDNVRISKDYLIGERDRGWYQVAVALDFERSGIGMFGRGKRILDEYASFVRETGIALTPAARMELADRAIENTVGRWMSYRIPWMQSQGLVPNYEASVTKLYGTELSQRLASTGMKLLGLRGQLREGSANAPLDGRVAHDYLETLSLTIGGGTSEVMRSVIATRGLGLPRE